MQKAKKSTWKAKSDQSEGKIIRKAKAKEIIWEVKKLKKVNTENEKYKNQKEGRAFL